MKKLMLILLTLGTATVFGQNGTNGYYGGGNGGQGQGRPNTYNSGTVTTYNTSGYGNNAYYSGGQTTYTPPAPACAPIPVCPAPRVRWEWSTCGTYQWRIEEVAYWVPGQYTYYNGCRRWVDGYYGWRNGPRTQVYAQHVCNNSCGHTTQTYGHGGHYGYHGNGHGHGGYNHGGHGHNGYGGGHTGNGHGGNGHGGHHGH